MFSLNGKTALITGSGRGIGLAIAEAMAHQGANIFLSDINSSVVERAAGELAEQYPNVAVRGLTFDVTDKAQIESAMQTIRDAGNGLQILVNNAGITADKLLMRMTESDFDNVLFTNLKGTFFCTKAASRLMMRQRYGRIINISSVVGLHGNAGQANYAASKAGLIGLTKSVAKEYAARNITANAVAPGFIETDMTAAMPESARAAAAAAIPAGRIGRAEDVAAAVAFLAGEQAGYITGQVLWECEVQL